jgi:hypothetical protein
MVILILVAAVVGTLLGLRCKFFVLVPIAGITLCIVTFSGLARGDGFGRITIMMIVAAVVLQLGYVLGNVIQAVIERPRSTHRRYSVSTPVEIPKSV